MGDFPEISDFLHLRLGMQTTAIKPVGLDPCPRGEKHRLGDPGSVTKPLCVSAALYENTTPRRPIALLGHEDSMC